MKRKEINARVISKHDTPTEWKMATDFVPEQGEIIIYDETNQIGSSKIKIGDGKRNINDLPFIAEPEKYVLKEAGKSLSTNDYINPDKNAVQKLVDFIEKNGEPKFTDTKYSAGTGLSLSNNMFSNTGVLDIGLQPHPNGDEPTYQEIVVTKANSKSTILKQPSYLLSDNFQPSSTSKPGVFEIKYYFQPNDDTEGHVVTREIKIEGCYSKEDIRDIISDQINEIPGIVSEIFIYNSTNENSESPAGQPLVIDSGTQTLYYRPDADSGLNMLFSKEMLDKAIMATEEELLPYDEENDTGLLMYDYVKLQIKPTSGKILYKDENNNFVPLILKDYLPITGGNITGNLAIDGSVTLKNPLAVENGGTGVTSLSELSNKLELNKTIVDITYDDVDSYIYTKMDGSTGSFPAVKTEVTVTSVLTSGEKIATITVDGVQNNLYIKSYLPITGGHITGDLTVDGSVNLKTPLTIENGGTGVTSLSELSNKLELNKAIVDITYNNVDSYIYTKMDGSTGSFPAIKGDQKTDVTVTSVLTNGEKIATITVDGVQNDLYIKNYLPIIGGHITGDLTIDGSVTLKTPLEVENGGTGVASLSELSNKLELNKAIVGIAYNNVDSYVYTKMDGSTGSFPVIKTNVTVTPVLTSGEKIATITVDGVQNNLYVKSYLPITGGTLTGDLILQRNTSNPSKSCRISAGNADLDKINGNSIELYNGSYIDFHVGYDGPSGAPDWSARLVEESAGGLTAYNWFHVKDKEHTAESTTYLRYNSIETTNITASGEIVGNKVTGAVWNDYAEYRAANIHEPGRVICETGEGSLVLATERLMPGCEIVSDTFGFSIGKTEENNTPVTIAGRVLAYTYEPRETFIAGEPVCSGPNGTVSKMTREEVKEYPDRIIGTVSEIPSYETWGGGNVLVNNRIWIRIR